MSNRVIWPDGQQAAAAFTFDVDAESAVLAVDPSAARSMSLMSHQAYGPRVGVPRILEILDRQHVRATFFVPGLTAELHPDIVRDIAAAGHEIAHHGYEHKKPSQLHVDEQIEQLDRGTDVLERLAGDRPIGYRAPMWDLSWEMPHLLAERGFLYDSSLMDNDVPYNLATQSSATAVSLIEIPIHWTLDDWEQYGFIPGISELGPIQTPDHAVSLWRSEFEATRDAGGCWVLTNHPFLSGRPGRAAALEMLIKEAVEDENVWVAAMDEIASHSTRSEVPRQIVEKPVQL